MNLLTKEQEAQLPPIGSTENNPDPTVWVKWFTPDSSFTWYVTERDPNTGLCFGVTVNLASNQPWELGYFSQPEIESVRGGLKLPVERDLWFKPQPLSQLEDKEENIPRMKPPQPASEKERIAQEPKPKKETDQNHVYVYNAQVQAHAVGLAWDPESNVAFYLSIAGSKNALRSLWTSMLARDKQSPELKMYNGWTDQNAFKGPSAGVHQSMVALKNTAFWQASISTAAPTSSSWKTTKGHLFRTATM